MAVIVIDVQNPSEESLDALSDFLYSDKFSKINDITILYEEGMSVRFSSKKPTECDHARFEKALKEQASFVAKTPSAEETKFIERQKRRERISAINTLEINGLIPQRDKIHLLKDELRGATLDEIKDIFDIGMLDLEDMFTVVSDILGEEPMFPKLKNFWMTDKALSDEELKGRYEMYKANKGSDFDKLLKRADEEAGKRSRAYDARKAGEELFEKEILEMLENIATLSTVDITSVTMHKTGKPKRSMSRNRRR